MSEKTKNKTASKTHFEELGQLLRKSKTELDKLKEKLVEFQNNKDKENVKNIKGELKKKTEVIEDLTKKWRRSDPNKLHLNRQEFDQFIIRRFFYIQSNEIHKGASGFYDYGPPMCGIQSNLLSYWRKHFILEENMLEVDTSIVTPEVVFQVSGHVKRFFDWMVRDVKEKNDCYRLDKLIEDFAEERMKNPKTSNEEIDEWKKILQVLDDYNGEQMDKIVMKYGMKSPKGNELSKSYPFNLMFKTTIGPSGSQVGYLRPETAQGIFVNFKRLYDYNGSKLPFASAQIGKSFRNEISPKSGLLRVREFVQAEIEHFLDPQDKHHTKYKYIKDLELVFFSRENQTNGKMEEKMKISTAMERGIIQNETLAYYLARTYLFFVKIGMIKECIRFRQHLQCEMAHYSSDCWDCELLTSFGWYEIVGLADRSAYDIGKHQEASKRDLFVHVKLDKPIIREYLKTEVDKKKFFKTFKRNSKKIMKYFEDLEDKDTMKRELETKDVEITVDGEKFTIKKGMVFYTVTQEKTHQRSFIPSVIEPSFGVGRMLYCLLEHSYWVRADPEKKNKIPRSVLSLEPFIAPYKAAILTHHSKPGYDKVIEKISRVLSASEISYRVDTSGRQVGRKYARCDDIGIPFGIVIDPDTIKEGEDFDTVTIRERDSCLQIRVKIEEVGNILNDVVKEKITWEECTKKFKEHKQTASEKVGKK